MTKQHCCLFFTIIQLSHYLDIVEVRIARQISQKSDAFFHAMTSHDELQEKLNHTVRCIKRLRLENVVITGTLLGWVLMALKLDFVWHFYCDSGFLQPPWIPGVLENSFNFISLPESFWRSVILFEIFWLLQKFWQSGHHTKIFKFCGME